MDYRNGYEGGGFRGTSGPQSTGTLGYVSQFDDEYASKTIANLRRAQWNDYMKRYPAIHQEFLDKSMSPDFTLAQVDRVQGNVDASFSRASQAQQGTLSRMGLSGSQADDGVAKSLAVAHGENSVRQHGQDRRVNMVGGGSLPNLQTQTGG